MIPLGMQQEINSNGVAIGFSAGEAEVLAELACDCGILQTCVEVLRTLRLRLWIAALVCLFGVYASAQTTLGGPRGVDASRFGERVALGPDWLFAPTDDSANASPTLDDSGWRVVSTQQPLLDYGFRDLHFAWYRMHVRLLPQARNLTLEIAGVDGSYEVYANGTKIGGNGGIGGPTYRHQRRMIDFPLDKGLLGPSGELVLALRFALNPGGEEALSTPLGSGAAVYLASRDAAARDESDLIAHAGAEFFIIFLLDIVVGSVAVALWFTARAHKEYLAAAIYLLAHALDFQLDLRFLLQDRTPFLEFAGFAAAATSEVAIIEFVRLVLGYRYSRWFFALEAVTFASIFWIPLMHVGVGTYQVDLFLFYLPLLFGNLVLIVLLARAARDGTPFAWLLLLPVLSYAVRRWWEFGTDLAYLLHLTSTIHSTPAIPLGSYHVSWGNMPDVFYEAMLLVFLIARTIAIARQQVRSAAELEAARTVQQVLVAVETPEIPALRIESTYRPAGEVGGDFFQVIPVSGGAGLIVVGDVSGKGTPAAMTVALLVGTVRTLAHYTESPGEILAAMNQRMMARANGGFTTCVVLRIEPDGKVIAANAGHIAPYVDGKEMELDNGLPLGLSAEAVYAETTFGVAPGSQITLLTDGVVEAMNGQGALFGFERTRRVSGQSAASIADAAQRFGQEDDITVLTMKFAAD